MRPEIVAIHRSNLARIKARGALWITGWNGKIYSDYSNPVEKFLLRFDEKDRALIRGAAKKDSLTSTFVDLALEVNEDAKREGGEPQPGRKKNPSPWRYGGW